MNTFKPFIDGDLDSVLKNQLVQLADKIQSEKRTYLLNVDENKYIDHLVSEFTVEVPVVNFDKKTISYGEKEIPADQHPSGAFFMFDEGKSYKRQVVTFHLPFSGDVEILKFRPNPSVLWTNEFIHTATSQGEELLFEVINFNDNLDDFNRRVNSIIDPLRTQLGHISKQVESYNSSLRQEATSLFQKRKEDLKKKGGFISQLGIPVRKVKNLPETFSIPSPKISKKIVSKPSATTTNPNPDPTLELDTYEEIVQTIHDLGKSIERMPSKYEGKTEENLRDYFLINLEPRFQGSATGETFNKKGKTDILLRYKNTNVFVAECKYWGGEKLLIETIDQILGYLTWRDSKSAIIFFVKNKEFTSVIDKMKNAIKSHENYLSFESEKEETCIRYKFALSGDQNREILLTVLLFHFPN